MDIDMNDGKDRIGPLFRDRHVLITGGTGFMGKALMEKLLRCTEVAKIYLLVRTKKGRTPKSRLEDIFANPLFATVIELRGLDVLLNHCVVIAGDVTEPDLAISEEDRRLITENVSIIYHCAATIRFDEALRKAVMLNTRGTKLMIELAKQCKKLDMFGYVSTSYCHLNEKLLLEKPYAPPADPHKVIKAVEWLEDEVVEGMTSKILGECPNTYAYTKALAEALVVESMKDIPAVIFRPSIVVPTWREPLSGWTDNINGPVGMLIGAGKGVIRSMYCNSDGYGDYLPVDFGVSAICVCTWNYIGRKDYTRNIYHLVSSAEIRVSWEGIIALGKSITADKVPLNGIFWYPGGTMKRYRWQHNLAALFFHWIPAVLIDCLLFVLGYKPVLCRVHRRIAKGFEVFEYYANNQWDFDNANVTFLRTTMNEAEKTKFKIDAGGVVIDEYFENCIWGARRFILKETDDTLPAARRHMTVMWWVDKICKAIIYGAFFYYVGLWLYNSVFSSVF
ncbi:putative fatty acyl-CoA reductase CG5065 [Toxorhynchites rutilus septentrionalis]|uniref:putative fatty acyl-CoA reductase CG5065 n=1 Tax=Toxorhynchites rutilus septentrionalis TaxID=329112 RepID=UPI00247A0E3B|nr:putative fatty acyl-CoA reductase CG5065 [Toxorhynchites rutilus septentrionalis]XP_055628469.1 putative fatty acyl-CoA reductase CG5065 [Toxorhynchites rutilus septentrionalis]XP_055628470.1 putative fatty acyl-CoA reductase CG5065 [Toxorhynchites rutilus septentrionalis]